MNTDILLLCTRDGSVLAVELSAYGKGDGDTPSCEVLAYLIGDEHDLHALLLPSVGDGNSAGSAAARRILLDLQKQARLLCSRLHKRRALVPLATQCSKGKALCIFRALSSDSMFSLAWLTSKSGAIRRRAWRTRANKRLAVRTATVALRTCFDHKGS